MAALWKTSVCFVLQDVPHLMQNRFACEFHRKESSVFLCAFHSYYLCTPKERTVVCRHLHGNNRRRDLWAAADEKRCIPTCGGYLHPLLWCQRWTSRGWLHLSWLLSLICHLSLNSDWHCWPRKQVDSFWMQSIFFKHTHFAVALTQFG